MTVKGGEELNTETVATTSPGEGIVAASTCTSVIRRMCAAAGPGTAKETPEKRMELVPFTVPKNTLTLGTWEDEGGLSISNSGCTPLATLAFKVIWILVTAVGPAVPPVQVSTRSPTCSAALPAGMFNGAGLDGLQVRAMPEKENFARKASKLPCPEV